MKKALIEAILENRTADKTVIDVLNGLPDEAYNELKYINEHILENGADWATRQFQSVIRKYLRQHRTKPSIKSRKSS